MPLRAQRVREAVHAAVGLGEGEPSLAADQRLPVRHGVDNGFPEVGEVVLHGLGG